MKFGIKVQLDAIGRDDCYEAMSKNRKGEFTAGNVLRKIQNTLVQESVLSGNCKAYIHPCMMSDCKERL